MTTDTLCGIIGFRPGWLQKFATSKWYMFIYGLLGTVQSMGYVYFIISLTTMEKRFNIPSKTTGIMLSGNEISQVMLSLFLSYFGGQRNKPKWIGWGVFISGLSCFILALPHFLYGAGEEALSLTKEYADNLLNISSSESINSKKSLCSATKPDDECIEVAYFSEYSLLPAILVFISQFVLGIGNTLYYSLGNAYLDDNTRKTNTPLFLGYALSLRMLGPVVGFMLGPLFLSFYIDPTLTPLINKNDTRWLGAWWLGWIVLGLMLILFSIFMGMFPKNLPKIITTKPDKDIPQYPKFTQIITSDIKNDEVPLSKIQYPIEDIPQITAVDNKTIDTEKEYEPTLKEFPYALRRLLKNKLLMANNGSAVFYVLGASGMMTFFSKYLEIQYNQPATSSMLVAGPLVLIGAVFGLISSGWFISKKRPKPRKLLGWNVFTGTIFLVANLINMFVGCPPTSIENQLIANERPNFINECNRDCMCTGVKYEPVCHKETGDIYYSACHAGCSGQLPHSQIYNNCSCVPEFPTFLLLNDSYTVGSTLANYTSAKDDWNTLRVGSCSIDCKIEFYIFVLVSVIANLFASTGRIGNILVNYRSVEKRDKAFAQGLLLLMISLGALIPGPIIYGIIFDSTCIEWGEKCGARTKCLMYDKSRLRFIMNVTTFGFTVIAVLLDSLVCYLGKNLVIYDEEENNSPKETNAIQGITNQNELK